MTRIFRENANPYAQEEAEETAQETLYLARTAMGKIIGKNGSRINLIRNSSKCSVTIDDSNQVRVGWGGFTIAKITKS